MYVQLFPTYTLRIEIRDGAPVAQQFQAGQAMHAVIGGAVPANPTGKYYSPAKTGCDDVLVAVRDALVKAGIPNANVTLERFEHK